MKMTSSAEAGIRTAVVALASPPQKEEAIAVLYDRRLVQIVDRIADRGLNPPSSIAVSGISGSTRATMAASDTIEVLA